MKTFLPFSYRQALLSHRCAGCKDRDRSQDGQHRSGLDVRAGPKAPGEDSKIAGHKLISYAL